MFPFSGLVVLALASLIALAAPTPENIALARKYAPQWRFHTSEIYWPSTVEYFLAGVKDNGVVDFYYWLFTPFNEGKNVILVGEVGDHVGDWERMAVRTVNGVATQVDYHAHSDDGSGTIPWAQVVKFDSDQRPVGYVAKGSHGFWATPGTFTYVNAVIFQLQDVTSDGGVYWDTRDSLVTLAYPDTFSGSLDWLNYKGFWGNIGETSCWWYSIYNECEIVGGPDGPYRTDVLGAAKSTVTTPSKDKMNGPLSVRMDTHGGSSDMADKLVCLKQQTLGTVSKDATSSFTFYLDASGRKIASGSGYTLLAINQTCISTVKPTEEGASPAIVTTSAVTELTDANKYTITPSACADNFTVTSYAVGVCADSALTDCSWAAARALRAYSPDASVPGIQAASAIVVTDLDNWRW
ncbi:hypothetical protein H0H87_003898 [Tephrocybe sp. NHM501043]|nr:hypothetical protein H0H87_003898 [Tephrocybe sp. NHM501043]